jgi:redox-sensitive bicupin YhaK (pirin superfamily)
MISIRRSEDRGTTSLGWLDSRHTFSFGDYHDPQHMGFRSLRVINDDKVAPEAGFGTHGHRDMEIITYVLSGTLAHRDSLGTGSELRHGDVQRMSAGAGIRHSEFNGSKEEPVHFLQIWILPEKNGLPPEYQERRFSGEDKRGRLKLVASHDGRGGSLIIHQDVELYSAVLPSQVHVKHQLRPGRHAWVQLASGTVTLNGQSLASGDGAALSDEPFLDIAGVDDAELLLFDLA